MENKKITLEDIDALIEVEKKTAVLDKEKQTKVINESKEGLENLKFLEKIKIVTKIDLPNTIELIENEHFTIRYKYNYEEHSDNHYVKGSHIIIEDKRYGYFGEYYYFIAIHPNGEYKEKHYDAKQFREMSEFLKANDELICRRLDYQIEAKWAERTQKVADLANKEY